MAEHKKKKFWRRWWHVILAVAITVSLLPLLVGESCPRSITIATGEAGSIYYELAIQYRELLARQGIELVVREAHGSVENVRLLMSPDENVSLAFVQGGISTPETRDGVRSLASLFYDPIWVFYRGPEKIERLSSLANKRVAVGGARVLGTKLLEENGVDRGSFVTVPPAEAADALKAGDVDAGFFALGADDALVGELLEAEDLRLMNFERADAYSKRYAYLSQVKLSQGVFDLRRNLPAEDYVLLAPTVTLVARADLHPALVPLLLDVARQVHERGGMLEDAGEFPSPHRVDFPLSDDARRYFQSGPSFLYRMLPFRLAARLDQIKLLAVPLLTLFLPLGKLFPIVYRWRIRSKIIRWYLVLREIDQKLEQSKGAADYSAEIARLRKLEIELAEISVPLGYMEEFYNMRLHVTYVMDLLEQHDRPPEKHEA